MRRLFLLLALSAFAGLVSASPATAAFGFKALDLTFTGPDGSASMQAGSHPFAMTTTIELNETTDPGSGQPTPDEAARDVAVELPPGFVGTPDPVPYCSTAEFLEVVQGYASCPDSTAVGINAANARLSPGPAEIIYSPVYSLKPPPGIAAKLGFIALSVPVTVEVKVSESYPHNVTAAATGISQVALFYSSALTLWGNPVDSAHDPLRGKCIDILGGTPTEPASLGNCPVSLPSVPFLTVPRACQGPLETLFEARSWQNPGTWVKGSALTHDEAGSPLGMTGCSKLAFGPSITAQPTSLAAQSPTGLDFSLDVKDEGLTNPTGLAHSDIRKVEVTLPEGMTVNPAIADGLEVCTPSQLERETAFSAPGAGCPAASKIGSIEVETPLLAEQVNGAIYQAQQDDPSTTSPGAENPFDSLIALYVVIKNPTLGILVTQPLRVIPDLNTGRLRTVAEDLPQLPFSSFRLHFREGARSPLATPPRCGTHEVKAVLTPWAGGPPVTSTSAFEIVTGPGAGPCPSGGLPPFKPLLQAGTLNNRAGSYSPFNLRLSRTDSEQEFTRFSIKLPPGLVGKLAGLSYCPDAAIEAAKLRTGAQEEISPSCPDSSLVGRTLVGAGVGPSPAYAPGRLYLAGPYNGSQLSLVAITAAKVGPFDLGTVVVRQALRIDRNTAEVFIDATASDPIPHIIDGVVVHARDIRAYVDRPDFVLNPTSCERTSTASTVLGAGLDFASPHDDNPLVVSSPFQAADCASLAFNPKLSFTLSGGTKRGAHPKLRAVLRMRPGEANITKARVTLPRSAFLDQSHIRTVCTRVQYAAKQCPGASIYGYAKAITPLFDTPVQGPIYLRSSSNKLPDLVAALANGQIEFDLVGRIDSLKGRIRNSFDFVPDAPVTEAVFSFQGAGKGLITNSTNLCRGKNRAIVELDAHNGKAKDFRPAVKASGCGGKGRKAPQRRH